MQLRASHIVTRSARKVNRIAPASPEWWRWAKATAHRAERRKVREALHTNCRVRNLGTPKVTRYDII